MPVLGQDVPAERLLADVSVPDADAADRAALADLRVVDAVVLTVDVRALAACALVLVADVWVSDALALANLVQLQYVSEERVTSSRLPW